MTNPVPKTCPGCGAPNKYPDRPTVDYSMGYPRNRPTIYTCGTVVSPDWSPPIYDKNCVAQGKQNV